MTTEIAVRETQFKERGQQALEAARTFEVNDETTMKSAVESRKTLRGWLADLDATFDKGIKAAHEAHKEAVATKARLANPLKEADAIYQKSISNFQLAEERRLDRERTAAEFEARKKAEAERAKEIKAAQKNGNKAAVKALKAEPLAVAPVAVKEIAKADGASFRDKWTALVRDPAALIRAVAEEKTAAHFVVPDFAALNKFAQATKGTVKVPGVEYVHEKIAVQRV